MARFMEIKSVIPKLPIKHMAKVVGFSDKTLQRYTKDMKMLSLRKPTVVNKRQIRSDNVRKRQFTSDNITKFNSKLKRDLT